MKHVKLTIKNKATSGELIIDRASIGYISSVTRDTLALPPVPQP